MRESMNTLELKVRQVFTHYKGKSYVITGFAKHTETSEDLVLYTLVSDLETDPSSKVWARPKSMFLDILEDGLPRFKLQGVRT